MRSLHDTDKKTVGTDIMAVQKEFPVGLPLCRKLNKDLYEVRSHITDGICRVLFTIDGDKMVLLHGFIKKSMKMPKDELNATMERLAEYRRLKR